MMTQEMRNYLANKNASTGLNVSYCEICSNPTHFIPCPRCGEDACSICLDAYGCER